MQSMNPIPIPMEDDLVHTDEQPFCNDESCPCHTDSDGLLAARGLIFEAVYGGTHHVEDCLNDECPCKELTQPFDDPYIEDLVAIRQVERGLTVEEARASLKDS